jgi:hypothetical protein
VGSTLPKYKPEFEWVGLSEISYNAIQYNTIILCFNNQLIIFVNWWSFEEFLFQYPHYLFSDLLRLSNVASIWEMKKIPNFSLYLHCCFAIPQWFNSSFFQLPNSVELISI